MKIIIDGYNALMAGSPSLSLGGGTSEQARDSFIDRLVSYKALKGHSIFIVFDGWRHGRPLEQSENFRGITVIFSKKGEKADEVIKRVVTPDGEEWVVISSDSEVRHFCKGRGAVVVHSLKFISKLNLAQYTVTKGIISDEDELEELTYRKRVKRGHQSTSPATRKYREAVKKL